MNDGNFLSCCCAVLGVVYEVVVVFVTRRYITLVIVSQKHKVALVGDFAELELLVELNRRKMILLAEVVNELVFGSFAVGVKDNLTYNVVAAALVLESAYLPLVDRIVLVESALYHKEIYALAVLINIRVGSSSHDSI